MDRRAFLRTLAAGLIGSTVDVDRLLWVPSAKTIFLPPAVTVVDEDWLMREFLRSMKSQVVAMGRFERMVAWPEVRPGAVVPVRLPERYEIGVV